MTRVRPAAPSGKAWNSTLLWYAKAVHLMRSRPITDPTSWLYQAAIHGTTTTPKKVAWATCTHGRWTFLPWHRAYLWQFESIVRAAIENLGGPADWSLPYWNYEGVGSGALPWAFRQAELPAGQLLHDGTNINPLFASLRDSGVNLGGNIGGLVSSAAANAENTFSATSTHGFGGAAPTIPASDQAGMLENGIHGDVHVIVGGQFPNNQVGWMGSFATAGLDPIFWLHHANIDRLWSEWLTHTPPLHANPAQSAWRSKSFKFFDKNGVAVTMKVSGVLDTVVQLDYRYDTQPVLIPDAVPDSGSPATAPEGGNVVNQRLAGASDTHAQLTGSRREIAVRIDAPTTNAIETARRHNNAIDAPTAATDPQKSLIELSDISAAASPGVVYKVSLHVGVDDVAGTRIGTASFFGVTASPRKADEHLHRLRYVYDVTELLASVRDQNALATTPLRVSFEPLIVTVDSPLDAPVAAEKDTDHTNQPVRVGRVALLLS